MYTKEEIIRKEARIFAEQNIMVSSFFRPDYINKLVEDIKVKLLDFHFEGYKAIFLNELLSEVPKVIGIFKSKFPNDNYEPLIYPSEQLLFYLQQEIDVLPKIAQTKSTKNSNRTRVFVSYNHADRDFVNQLKRHFVPFKEIDFWDDSRIEPGQKSKEEIGKALNEAKVAILLISADYFNCEIIFNNELPPLLNAADKDGAIILIVILKPVAFEAYPAINQFQTMNSPANPVIKMSDLEREDLWVNVFRNAKKALEA